MYNQLRHKVADAFTLPASLPLDDSRSYSPDQSFHLLGSVGGLARYMYAEDRAADEVPLAKQNLWKGSLALLIWLIS